MCFYGEESSGEGQAEERANDGQENASRGSQTRKHWEQLLDEEETKVMTDAQG